MSNHFLIEARLIFEISTNQKKVFPKYRFVSSSFFGKTSKFEIVQNFRIQAKISPLKTTNRNAKNFNHVKLEINPQTFTGKNWFANLNFPKTSIQIFRWKLTFEKAQNTTPKISEMITTNRFRIFQPKLLPVQVFMLNTWFWKICSPDLIQFTALDFYFSKIKFSIPKMDCYTFQFRYA